jgi:diguanylate cyclase (GGDEF)-like protein
MELNRSNRDFPEPLAVVMRLAVLIFMIAGMVEQRSSGWWRSGWYWAVLAALVSATAATAWRVRERDHRLRQRILESSVSERTADLERERQREWERSHILEMLVSNEPLGSILGAVLRSIRSQCPETLAAVILRKTADGSQVVSSLDMPPEWLTALCAPCAVPFEVWRWPLSNQHPSRDPAWKLFRDRIESPAPGIAWSRPISKIEEQPGAILLFYGPEALSGESADRAIEIAERTARLAIEQSRLYDSLHYQAHHDNLTGLPNRALFEEHLDRALNEAAALGRHVAVLFVDLDRFKRVNDTFSHRVGDLFLREMANRMKGALRPSDTVARIGGDEFTIVLHEVRDASEAAQIAGRVMDAMRPPLSIEGHEIVASASIGIALFPEDGNDAETLQRAADAAMYYAKDLGRDRAESFSTRNETLDLTRMDEELRVALREGYFVVHYQPKVGVDRKLAGFEALVRMNHPVHGLIPPLNFIPLAESNGLIVPLGAWVLNEACRQIAAWEARGLSPISMAVNVSPVQICRSDFAKSVAECLARNGVAASSLELELTESLLINAVGEAQEQLRALRALGIRLSIDDFGTGYSSLSYLHRLPVDAIKLDRSFVQSIDTDDLAQRLVNAMIGVAHGLGLSVVAEGVETEAQRDALLTAGCSLMQGFLFAHPQPAAELEEFLRASHGNDGNDENDGNVGSDGTVGASVGLRQLTASMQLSGELAAEPLSA